MGFSTINVHILGAKKQDVLPLLSPDELLREHNAPWLDVLGKSADFQRMEGLSRKLTKAIPGSVALVFSYFDDDSFLCRLFQNGKQAATCDSFGSWAKLAPPLCAILGDDLPAKAFRHAADCADLAEQVQLLEETLGTALLDDLDAAPKTVKRCDSLLCTLKQRQAALRKRKNQYSLTEVEAFPQDWQSQLCLLRACSDMWLLTSFGAADFSVPNHPELSVCQSHDGHVFCCDGEKVTELSLPNKQLRQVLWYTEQKAFVCLLSELVQEVNLPTGRHCIYGEEFVCCITKDGRIRWRFLGKDSIRFISASKDGVLTLCAYNCSEIYQLNAETGKLLLSRTVPAGDGLRALVFAGALQSYVYISKENELVILDGALNENARFPGCKSTQYIKKENIVGSRLWYQAYPERKVRLYDLMTGSTEEIALEVPALVLSVLKDGRILGINEKQPHLSVFDPAGRVVSRHLLPGMVTRVREDAEAVYLLEVRAPASRSTRDDHFEDATIHVHRLEALG